MKSTNAYRICSLAACLLSLPLATQAYTPVSTTLPAIHDDPSLVGRTVRVAACAALPLSANPHREDDLVVLYPCGQPAKDGMPEHAIVGQITSDRIVKPFKDAGIEFTGEVSATFTGPLTKVDAGDSESDAYFVLAIESVPDPSERHR